WYLRWFDYWLRGRGDGLASMPRYLVYVIGEERWLEASEWPPTEVRFEKWYLGSVGGANGRKGDGFLSVAQPSVGARAYDEFNYDPANPVPTRGGPACCTGLPDEKQGPTDQTAVEEREDVLVYTSAPLEKPLRIAGPLAATLQVSSSALDTDFVVRLVHVWPDGRSTNIQEGALRARYRNGINRPELLQPGNPVDLQVDVRSIAYTIPQGHRLRLHVTSSSFPRLERNLNTGGRNFDESVGIVATNRVYHGPGQVSFIRLPILP
ncbi:MAG: CocE/NonD family hydrolase, partial [Usitatibacteraceae bacterium]